MKDSKRRKFKADFKAQVALEAVKERKTLTELAQQFNLMGLTALYPKPDLSKANKAHKKYPYLIRNMVINQVNQVWSSDITYIPMKNGFLYLVAVMDGPAHPEHRRSGTQDMYSPGGCPTAWKAVFA